MSGTIQNALRVALRINSGKNIYNFGIAERLRALRYSIFTGGVVAGKGRCSAAFCESAALRESFCLAQAGGTLSVFASQIHLPRKGEVLLYLPEGAEKLPLRGSWLRTQ